jgi:hypothetical protein
VVSNGQWNLLEFHWKTNTSGNNGIFEFWINDILIYSRSDLNFSGNPVNYVLFPSNNVALPNIGASAYYDEDDFAFSATGKIGAYGGSADTTPDVFTFTDQTGVSPGSTNNSDSVTSAGYDNTATLVLTGDASCKYSINGAAWATADNTVTVGDNVALQNVASSSYSTPVSCTLNLGGISDTFSRTTEAAVADTSLPRLIGNKR